VHLQIPCGGLGEPLEIATEFVTPAFNQQHVEPMLRHLERGHDAGRARADDG
jgi:hypothetical protein